MSCCVVQEETKDLLEHHIKQIHREEKTVKPPGSENDPPPTPGRTSRLYGLVIDGKTLSFALDPDLEKMFLLLAGKCNSVICCRSSPIQKVGKSCCITQF